MSVGVFRRVMGAAAGLYQTYDIMFNPEPFPGGGESRTRQRLGDGITDRGGFCQGLITGGQAWYEGDKGKALEAGSGSASASWLHSGRSAACRHCRYFPWRRNPSLPVPTMHARRRTSFRHGWSLVTGRWRKNRGTSKAFSTGTSRFHAITYKDLLTEAGNRPYKSEMADGLLGIDVTMNDSIRGTTPKNMSCPSTRPSPACGTRLKNLYPRFQRQGLER